MPRKNKETEAAANRKAWKAAWKAANVVSGEYGRQINARNGTAAELFVMADLMRMGFEVTKPLSPTAPHDAHVKIGSWKGVQVKVTPLVKGKPYLAPYKARKNKSPILALVYPRTWVVEYRAGTEPLPPELITKLEKSIRGFEKWQHNLSN